MGRTKEGAGQKRKIALTIEFHPEVEIDLADARDFYEKRRNGLGDEFLLSVEATFNYISRNPLHFPIVFSKTRHALIKRFPFAVFYLIHKGKIYVSAVVHLSRNPKLWQKRK